MPFNFEAFSFYFTVLFLFMSLFGIMFAESEEESWDWTFGMITMFFIMLILAWFW